MLKSFSLACLMLLSVSVSVAVAQTHVIEVRNGHIYVDGRVVEGSAYALIPAIDARFVAPSDVAIMIELDGRILRITPEGAQEIDGSLLTLPVEGGSRDAARESSPAEANFIAAQAEELRLRAREMERIGVQLQSARVPDYELFQMIELLRQSAMEAERVAQALPHFRVQGYLSDVREQNEELYERLVREQRLEAESVRLSGEIRALAGSERESRIADLRQRLEEIFQIKQENRQREIEELETRLHSMQQRLEKRARYHDYIIERRLNELIGSDGGGMP
jgi:hypothetical protein